MHLLLEGDASLGRRKTASALDSPRFVPVSHLFPAHAGPMNSDNVGDLLAIVLIGPSGSGKTTVGRELAARRGAVFVDADDFHSTEAIEKMSRGIGLSDDDRLPWLSRLAAILHAPQTHPEIVLACSALKTKYREVLANGTRKVVFIYLRVELEELARRLTERQGHFAGTSLLLSQLDALEVPGPDEIIDAGLSFEQVCAAVEDRLLLVAPLAPSERKEA